MKTKSTFKVVRKSVIALLSVGLLAMPACTAGDEGAEEGSFFDPSEGAVSEGVGTAAQALVRSSLCANPSTATITGTAGDDYILGTAGNDVIFALGGDDVVDGKGGDDIICGGDGNDHLSGGDGNDQIEGGAGYNWLRGDGGDDILIGGDDGNEIQGNAGNDAVYGGAGADTLYGGDGDDKIEGGAGNDYIAAGAGNDCIDGGDGHDSIYGEDGDDNVKGGADPDYLYCGAGNDVHESDGSDGVYGCETAGTVNCFQTCSCNTPGSFFEAYVTGAVTFTPNVDGFCTNSSSTGLVFVNGGAVAAGGEAGFTGSGDWACESSGGYAGDVGFVLGLSPEEGQFCGDLVRDAMVAQGINPPTQCQGW